MLYLVEVPPAMSEYLRKMDIPVEHHLNKLLSTADFGEGELSKVRVRTTTFGELKAQQEPHCTHSCLETNTPKREDTP